MIVDDNPGSIDLLEILLRDIPTIQLLATATSADEALPLIVKHEPDLLFLDVEMPSKTGFDLVEDLRRINAIPIIIFTTAYEKYAINAIRCAAFDFLLKPIDPEELKHAVALATASLLTKDRAKNADQLISHLKRERRIKLPSRNGFILIVPYDILYIVADWSYSTIFLANGKNETVSMNIGALEKLLPEGHFFRISRSIMIQLNYLQSLDRKNKKCYLKIGNEEKTFTITAKRMKELDGIDF